ncbi:phytosulfokine 4 precursor [Hibiscus trionum]|uniref:Phytosulfokine n=1 Tax=Hibiscus trionum TaxID=183268 RepID=A0A9W7M059_HIBTR|nr:phytosulfokine 4 precursor [Hibiscus trionum]
MSKLRTLFVAAILLNFMLCYGVRPDPALPLTKHHRVDVDETCEGVGKEECLMRRTLAAHVDYIYTQNHKPWSLFLVGENNTMLV